MTMTMQTGKRQKLSYFIIYQTNKNTTITHRMAVFVFTLFIYKGKQIDRKTDVGILSLSV